MRRTTRSAGRFGFAVVWVVSLVVLFSPASSVPGGLEINDKVVHFLVFAALAVTGRIAGFAPVPLGAALLGYAALSEVLQVVLPIGRDGDWGDVVSDVLGVMAGLLVTALVRGHRELGERG